jgi:Uncharacterized conserved protein
MFWLKKMMGGLLMPMPLALLLLLSGLVLLCFTRRQRLGKALSALAFVVLLLFSLKPVANFLLIPLEQRYPPIPETASIDYILVLGNGHSSDPAIPLTSQPSSTAMARIMEGIALKQRHPQAKLVVSGNSPYDPRSCARMYAMMAEYYGIPAAEIILIEDAFDTQDEINHYKTLIGEHSAALVTSASHMPRAMRMAKQAKLNVIAASTDFQGKQPQAPLPVYAYLPNPENLKDSEAAIHEWLGILWNEGIQKVKSWPLSSTKTDMDQETP